MCYRILRTELRQRTQARIDREVEELLEEDQGGQDSGGAGRRQHHDPCAVGPLQRQRCRESAARVALWAVHSWGGMVQSALRECLESELAAHSRDVLLAIFACV